MHEGHRRRMINKLMNKKQARSDHEILEILLFYCIPRINVNELAHKLLDSFGSLSNIIKSDPKAICTIDGIGEKTAEYLVVLGELFVRATLNEKNKISLFNFETCKPVLKASFNNMSEEVFLAIYLDKSGSMIFKKIFCSHNIANVDIDLDKLIEGVDSVKPESVIVAHNHISGNVLPSLKDDDATRQIAFCLEKLNVKLVDHIIVCKNNFFSYHSSGRLEKLFLETL